MWYDNNEASIAADRETAARLHEQDRQREAETRAQAERHTARLKELGLDDIRHLNTIERLIRIKQFADQQGLIGEEVRDEFEQFFTKENLAIFVGAVAGMSAVAKGAAKFGGAYGKAAVGVGLVALFALFTAEDLRRINRLFTQAEEATKSGHLKNLAPELADLFGRLALEGTLLAVLTLLGVATRGKPKSGSKAKNNPDDFSSKTRPQKPDSRTGRGTQDFGTSPAGPHTTRTGPRADRGFTNPESPTTKPTRPTPDTPPHPRGRNIDGRPLTGSQLAPDRPAPSSAPTRLRKQTGTVKAESVNATFPKDYHPPYKPGTSVTRFETGTEEAFVRLHGADNQIGGWVVKKDAIRGLTPAEVQSKYALPSAPTHISAVTVPAKTKMEFGTVNPGFPGVPPGGRARQYRLLDRLDPSAFQNMRPLQ
jgi:hypothetical protein